MQEIWESGVNWDEVLLEAIRHEFQRWCDDLENLGDVKIQRCLCPHGEENVEIHTFVDASSEAYGAVSYLRTVSNTTTSVRLVAVKTRVASLKSTSIPRLELMGAMLGLKLTESIVKALKVQMRDVIFWSDSMNALWWIRGREV